MTITGSDFTRATTFPGFPSGDEVGTVALKSEPVYTFTADDGTTYDYTLSDDGDTLTNTDNAILGEHTYTRD